MTAFISKITGNSRARPSTRVTGPWPNRPLCRRSGRRSKASSASTGTSRS
jgi:hypothetical protein